MNFLKLLYPAKCPFCDRLIPESRYNHEGLCETCEKLLMRPAKADVLPHSALPFVLNLYCPLIYAGAVKDAMIRYKFGGENWLQVPFSKILHQYLIANDGYRYCAYITNVPVSGKRFRQRGYDQAGLIAKRLARLSGIPYRSLLARNEESSTLTSKMNRERRLQARRFRILTEKKEGVPEGACILLIDDILTTGSTLNECAELLLKAGVGSVAAAVMASGRRDIGGACA